MIDLGNIMSESLIKNMKLTDFLPRGWAKSFAKSEKIDESTVSKVLSDKLKDNFEIKKEAIKVARHHLQASKDFLDSLPPQE